MNHWYFLKAYPSSIRAKGVSLVELLVSILISIVILHGVVQAVISSQHSYLNFQEMSYIQENARYAVNRLKNEVRMAGYFGCAGTNPQMANAITGIDPIFISTIGIEGYEGESNTIKLPQSFRQHALKGTDSIIIRGGNIQQEYWVKNHNSKLHTINLWREHPFAKGTPLIISDPSCRNVGFFTHNGNKKNTTLNHSISQYNCTSKLKGDFSCRQCSKETCAHKIANSPYQTGARVLPYTANAYFIAKSHNFPDSTALKQQTLAINDNTLEITTTEIAVGVEGMDIIYGVDTDEDKVINEYRKADQMDLDLNGYIEKQDWQKILTVKITLILRSQTEVYPDAQTVLINKKEYSDRYLRQAVSAIVKIRNRG